MGMLIMYVNYIKHPSTQRTGKVHKHFRTCSDTEMKGTSHNSIKTHTFPDIKTY